MPTRTYVFLIEKPDDSYEQRVEAISLHDARIMMAQEIQKQPDWLSYRLLDTVDHDDEDEEGEEVDT
jgi:phosphatidylserine/phosphatidylglycerophosphate/cardiolipin synthase-like enzyme